MRDRRSALRYRRMDRAVAGCLLGLFVVLVSACNLGTSSSAPAPVAVGGVVAAGGPVVGATVAFVEAAALTAGESSLQPLEDAAPAAAFRAITGSAGEYSLEVPPGRYFVYVTPAVGDTLRLPGGSLARRAVTVAAPAVTPFHVTLSERPPAAATYVGSSVCLGCHPEQSTVAGTLHAVGLRRLTAAGPVLAAGQDLSAFPDADAALEYFPDGNPADNTGVADGFGYRVDTTAGYRILLGVDATGYFQALESTDGVFVSERLYVVFTYGGEGRFRQLFATRLDAGGAFTGDATLGSYHLLPAQFSETRGDAGRAMEVTVPSWTTYHAERWGAPVSGGAPAGGTPAPVESFDNDCAGCHLTGMTLTRDADGLFQAHAVADAAGALDYDGDGLAEEVNVGCERCHGPGSEHAAAGGGSIVQPAYLPPGRANLLCGQCHALGRGNGVVAGAGEGGYPSRNAPGGGEFELFAVGDSPATFFGTSDGRGVLPDFGTAGGFFDPVDLSAAPSSWRDRSGGFDSRFDHGREGRWHYYDHARSAHARNDSHLLVCGDCHDPHAIERRGQTRREQDTNVLCLDCHAGGGEFAAVTADMVEAVAAGGASAIALNDATHEHVTERTFDLVDVAMNLGAPAYANPGGSDALGRCTLCHMPRTGASGGFVEDDEGFPVRGNVTSHAFDVISPETSEAMALAGAAPVIDSCVECHRGVLRGAWPDYRQRE